MNGCRHSFWVPALSAMVAIFGAGSVSAQTAPAADGKSLPSFLGSDRLPDLMAARDAVIARHKAALAAREATKEAEIRLLAASDDVNRRAEAERVLAADIRLRAEALSVKFASELPAEAEPAKLTFVTPEAPEIARAVTAQAQPAVVKTPAATASGTAGIKPQQVVAAIETSAVDTATTLAMQRATDALTSRQSRSRRDQPSRRGSQSAVACSQGGLDHRHSRNRRSPPRSHRCGRSSSARARRQTARPAGKHCRRRQRTGHLRHDCDSRKERAHDSAVRARRRGPLTLPNSTNSKRRRRDRTGLVFFVRCNMEGVEGRCPSASKTDRRNRQLSD